MKRACTVCGAVTSNGNRCTLHHRGNQGYSTNRDNTAHVRWARAVKKRDGYVCQVCGATDRLQAHHRIPLRDGGTHTLNNGITLCATHHQAIDPYAR